MCAIFGSYNLSHFVRLYLRNKFRGNFSFGVAVLPNNANSWEIHKTTDSEETFRILEKYGQNCKYYLGHIQAPTGSDRSINENTIHPFSYNKIHVAHNGILTNHEELKREFNYTNTDVNVDSSIIPYIINHYKNLGKTSEQAIIETCNKLKGTFSLWVIDETGELYICRLSSTLFYQENWFTSVEYMSMVPVPERTLFKLDLNKNTFYNVGTFTADSHFFTLGA